MSVKDSRAVIDSADDFKGYSRYMDGLLNDEFFGRICTTDEAEKMFRPTNHGYRLSDLYADFREDVEQE